MWKLKRYLRPYWVATLLAPLLMILEVYMDLLQPKLMASIVNDGIMQGNLPHIQSTGAMMLGIALIGLIGGAGCTLFSSIAAQNFGADVRKDLFAKVQTFSFRNLDRFSTGSLVTRLTQDIVQIQLLVQMTLRILVRAPLLIVGSFVMAMLISPRLGLILIVAIPLLSLTLYTLIRLSFPLFAKVQAKLDGVNTVLQENLSGIRVVKAFVRSAYEQSRFGRANRDYTDMALKAARVVAFNMPIMTLILNLSIVAVLWFGGAQNWEGSLSIGELAAFINYVMQLLSSLMMVGMMLVNVSRAKVSADRINEVFAVQPDIADAPDARRDCIRSGQVVFDRVSFSYGSDGEKTKLVLEDISFTAEAGQTVAILGAIGSGKTSLVSLIPRLYEPDSGRVLIDGADVSKLPLDELRSHIGMVLQQSILFTGPIRDNIRFGKPDATLEEVEAAAKAAQAHDFIMELPDGYDTVLGQRGVNLSGGQKQRIAIARALVLRPAILILDDSTSAVDLRTEALIQQALGELMERSTCFVIAQRISSVRQADLILVLEDGRITAQGTHDELIRSSAVYQDIYRSQQTKEDALHG
ncbi:ATP-binding cassette, subfamily B [Paenibacillus sp. UNCCL117]|uniref:ABC transporter ATP-binding protein n=1 Tax=unclassified Paenibacillus TaxID=185978 RepID=UPI0008879D98|nr:MULTISPECIES: ABC transporter ATP-binding protein [unclassified Paenibacillus]SDE46465.1 ATP-binding cassette, subfamily B [Paenibacillus sp. cl123]SFW65847.1 ATP-binding cassette, subfamily B [Paenibacillus sp. UNCCL117]